MLDRLRFDPSTDYLWLVGDLVNRGPHSLETLRFVRALGASAVSVLGNHDLHLLAVACGSQTLKSGDTLSALLAAPDAPELLAWLRHRPLLHHDAALGWTMVHAGLPPQWDLALALSCAREVEAQLCRTADATLFASLYGNDPSQWSARLSGIERMRYAVNALTRMRYVNADGALTFSYKGSPAGAPVELTPWFLAPDRRNRSLRIVFGHWSTLGIIREPHLLALDSGCVWGKSLSAVQLDDPEHPITSVDCS